MRTLTLRRPITFELLGHRNGTVSVPVTMVWSSDDPLAIKLRIKASRRRVIVWIVARDLLADGLLFSAGVGDVRVQPYEDHPEWMLLTLDSPDGRADLLVPVDALGGFLADTFGEVPAGAETIPDELFLELLAS
jgi:hypothetical protein